MRRHSARGLAVLASAAVGLSACGDAPNDGTQAYESVEEMVDELLVDDLVCFDVSGADLQARDDECEIGDTRVRLVIWASADERDEQVARLRSTLDVLSVPYCFLVGEGAEATWSVDVEVDGDGYCERVAAVYGVEPIRS